MKNPAEAAALLNVREGLLAQWRSEGKGPPFIKLGGIVRYDERDLEEFINASRRTSTVIEQPRRLA